MAQVMAAAGKGVTEFGFRRRIGLLPCKTRRAKTWAGERQCITTNPAVVPPVPAPLQPGATGASGEVDTETLALLEAWSREDATDDPEKLRAARKELDEFKRAMNENRAATGERILYP